jgi:hypothetical protein
MEEENISIPNNDIRKDDDKISKTEQKFSKESISKKVKKYLKNFFKYSLITIVVIIALYFITFFIKENSLKSLEASKIWKDSIPYFNITLTTSFRYNNVWDDDGKLLYQLSLEGDTTKFKYNNYDSNGKIKIGFFDAEGFKIDEYELTMRDFTRLVNNKDEIIGFSRKDNWYVSIKDLKSFNKIGVSWTVSFEKK